MSMEKRPLLSAVLGLFSAVILAHIVVVFFAPLSWHMRYPGGTPFLLAAVIVSIGMSIIAGSVGARAWFTLVVVAIGIVVYLLWFYRPPAWY